jgi:hypothetical protein
MMLRPTRANCTYCFTVGSLTVIVVDGTPGSRPGPEMTSEAGAEQLISVTPRLVLTGTSVWSSQISTPEPPAGGYTGPAANAGEATPITAAAATATSMPTRRSRMAHPPCSTVVITVEHSPTTPAASGGAPGRLSLPPTLPASGA